MFENLTDNLALAIKRLKGQGKITEINVATTVKEIRRALIKADVHYKVAKDVTNKIKEKALGREVLLAVSPGEMLTKIVSDELTDLMGSTSTDITLKGNPAIILVAGLQGSGKTTFCAKFAARLKNQGKQVALAACDIYRPAAIDQLKVLAEQIEVPVYAEPASKEVSKIAQNAVLYAKDRQCDVLIVDTAGRLAVDEAMMEEVAQLKQVLHPSETLFVVDAMTGQDAVNTARIFNERLDFDGVVLTKLDGDTRGGAAISIRTVVNKPIKFISTGEKVSNLDVFHPDRMASRILGMGDVVSMVERAQQVYNEQEVRRLTKKISKNQFDFNDFLAQIRQIKRMGSLKDLIGLLPGIGSRVKELNIDDDAFKPFEVIISSMTPYERAHPDVIDKGRRERIAKGSGVPPETVNHLIKHFNHIRKMIQKVNRPSTKRLFNLPKA